MKVVRYSRWDGTQAEFALDVDATLDALSDLMMNGLGAREAIDHMRRHGFDLAGQDFRVMGTQELMHALRRATKELAERYHLDDAMAEQEQKYQQMLELEQGTLEQEHGYESRAMNDFLDRRHSEARSLADRVGRFDGYRFENREARELYEELKREQERMQKLESFMEQAGRHFHGSDAADYEQAQQIRERLEGIRQSLQALRDGNLEQVDPEALRDLLGEQAQRSLLILRDFEDRMRDRGYLRGEGGDEQLTPRAMHRIGAQALASVYRGLRKARRGQHETHARGVGSPRPDESRPYRFGDSLSVDVVKSVINGLRRQARDAAMAPGSLTLQVEDLEVHETDFTTQTTTVLLLDLSWSMSFEDRFPAAKRVALAMDQLIRSQFPRDHFFVVGFSTRARELRGSELLEVSWDPSDPFTNLQEGLMVAERLIVEHPSPSPQVLVITDGQPTAYFTDDDELHVEWPNGRGGVSPRAVAQTLKQVQRVTRRGITINTFMLHDAPELVGFVERMTEVNRGRALFTDPAHLGSYVMVDHMSKRRR